jgi:flavodoxin-like protein
MCLLIINCRVGGILNVNAASYRFEPTLRSVSLPRADRRVRHPLEGFAPGWKGRGPRPQRNTMPPVNAEWVGAAYTPEEARTRQQKELLSLSDSLLAELEQADEYVIGVPMHNFGVPSVPSYGSTRLRESAGPFPMGTGGRRA